MSGIWPAKTWIPTPLRKPTNTEADRKSPRNPSFSSRAIRSMPPQTNATSEVKANQVGEFGVRPAMLRLASPAARMAAVAESAPTTSNLDEASRANTRVGKITVYSPVTTGTCAMDV